MNDESFVYAPLKCLQKKYRDFYYRQHLLQTLHGPLPRLTLEEINELGNEPSLLRQSTMGIESSSKSDKDAQL